MNREEADFAPSAYFDSAILESRLVEHDEWPTRPRKASSVCLQLDMRASDFVIVRWGRRLNVAIFN